MSDKERLVKEFIEKHGNVSIKEISEQINTTTAYTSRILRKLQDKKIIEAVGEGRSKKYIVKLFYLRNIKIIMYVIGG